MEMGPHSFVPPAVLSVQSARKCLAGECLSVRACVCLCVLPGNTLMCSEAKWYTHTHTRTHTITKRELLTAWSNGRIIAQVALIIIIIIIICCDIQFLHLAVCVHVREYVCVCVCVSRGDKPSLFFLSPPMFRLSPWEDWEWQLRVPPRECE